MARRHLLTGVAAAAVVLLAAACSSSSDSGGGSTSATTANTSAASSPAAGSEGSAAASSSEIVAPSSVADQSGAEATSDGTFSMAVTEPDHLTPGRQTVSYDQMGVLFAPLTFVNDDGTLSYRQAESVTSDDATTWTVKLKPGWTFHNGETVTSKSYVDAWNAVALRLQCVGQQWRVGQDQGL